MNTPLPQHDGAFGNFKTKSGRELVNVILENGGTNVTFGGKRFQFRLRFRNVEELWWSIEDRLMDGKGAFGDDLAK